jgi:hypothetical protein
VHFYDPHYPDHVNPSLAGTKFAGVASYDGEVAFMDQQLGRLLELLDATGRAATRSSSRWRITAKGSAITASTSTAIF